MNAIQIQIKTYHQQLQYSKQMVVGLFSFMTVHLIINSLVLQPTQNQLHQMCKFSLPVVPETATPDEKRAIMFEALSSLNLNDMCEKRNDLTYLPWSDCMDVLRSVFPSATYRVIKNSDGLPYFADPNTGIMCFTEVTIDGITSECFLPVMDYKNQAMKLTPYTYQAWNSFKKCNEEKSVAAATMFDINKTIWRCLVKNIAIATGIGLYIFKGEDVPSEKSLEEANAQQQAPTPAPQPKPFDKYAGIKATINGCNDVNELMSFYLDHEAEISANPQLKQLLTARKQQIQSLKTA